MNSWHDVALGENPTTRFDCVIEIPRGAKNKYELDKRTGLLRLDRVLYSAVHYPADYGFLPRTYCEDGDALDVLVLSREPVVPLCIVTARPIGVITKSDEKGQDDKILAVSHFDAEYADIDDVSQLSVHRLRELERFFLDYKTLEEKEVNIEDLRGREEAGKVILDAVGLYDREIAPSRA